MVFPKRYQKRSNITRPCERRPLLEIIGIMIVVEGFDLKRIVSVCDIVTLAIAPSEEIEEGIKKPVKDEQHFNLLPVMDLFVANQLRLVVRLTCDPDENEKG